MPWSGTRASMTASSIRPASAVPGPGHARGPGTLTLRTYTTSPRTCWASRLPMGGACASPPRQKQQLRGRRGRWSGVSSSSSRVEHLRPAQATQEGQRLEVGQVESFMAAFGDSNYYLCICGTVLQNCNHAQCFN